MIIQRDQDYLTKLILCDVLNAIDAIWGQEGLDKVTEHARLANQSRDSNDLIDEIEASLNEAHIR